MTIVRPDNIDRYRGVSLSTTNFDHIKEFKELVGERNGRTVKVSASTLDALKQGNEAILKVLGTDCAPDGMGNGIVSLYGSGGRAYVRRKMALTYTDKDLALPVKAKQWIKFGGLNCGDINGVVYSELQASGHPRPLMLVPDLEDDHGYVISGDPNKPEEAVIIDAYASAACTHTLAEAQDAKPGIGIPLAKWKPGDPTYSFSVEEEVQKPRASEAEIEAFRKERGYPEIGRDALQWLANDGAQVKLWDLKKSAKDVSVVYQDDTDRSGVFNYVPEDYLMRHLINRAYVKADGFPDNYRPPFDLAKEVRISTRPGDTTFDELKKWLEEKE